ncbi:MAG: 4Fe-4S dicluster domain-containing protein [Erysipelotrichaceae bacterium]
MEQTKLTAEQIKSVKGVGFLHNRGTRNFNGRIISENGMITAEQMRVVSEAARLYGNGTVAFTVRLTLEVPGIAFENIQPFREYIAQADLVTGGTGAKVRPIVSCKGTTCVFGLCDTMGLAKEIHDQFFVGYNEVALPHKFKIAVGGCPNNCAKPDLNDLGIVGQRVMEYSADKCRNCRICSVQKACPMNAVEIVEGRFVHDKDLCNNCGRCFKKCPFGVTQDATDMFKIYVGGKWGKKIRMGSALSALYTHDEVLEMVEKSILLFKREGVTKERFGDTIDRLGVERVDALLQTNELLEQKEAIVHGEVRANA